MNEKLPRCRFLGEFGGCGNPAEAGKYAVETLAIEGQSRTCGPAIQGLAQSVCPGYEPYVKAPDVLPLSGTERYG